LERSSPFAIRFSPEDNRLSQVRTNVEDLLDANRAGRSPNFGLKRKANSKQRRAELPLFAQPCPVGTQPLDLVADDLDGAGDGYGEDQPHRAPQPSPEEQRQGDGQGIQLQALAQELRGIGETLEGRSWVQRSKLKEITGRIEQISEELERPWEESDTGFYESVVPPND